MVGSNRVSKVQEAVRVFNELDDGQVLSEGFEERGVVDVGALLLPLLAVGLGGLECVPAGSALADFVIHLREHVRLHVFVHSLGHFFSTRPDVAQEYILAILVLSDRFGLKVDVRTSGKCIRNYQRRRCQVCSLDVSMNAGFEVAVSGQNCTCDQVLVFNDFGDVVVQIPRVSDAGHAPEACNEESLLFKVFQQVSIFELLLHDS